MKTMIILLQTLMLIALAPLLSGLIRKIKNNLRMRKGAVVVQPYYNFFKLMAKEEVISENVSWIFRITPYIVLSTVILALFMVPVILSEAPLNITGDFIVIIFLLSAGRFFMALSALEAGSAFGGMGSSREMFISSLVEPIALLTVFAVSINAQSTSLYAVFMQNNMQVSAVIAGMALLFVAIAETSRLPVDNQKTHLELTMIHEAMVLEYSGRSLALIELAGYIKQIIFFTLTVNIIIPFNLFPAGDIFAVSLNIAVYFLKLLTLCALIGFIEVMSAKVRLFRVVDFLAFGLVLATIAVIIALLGY